MLGQLDHIKFKSINMKNKITLIQFLFFLCLFLFSNTAFSQAPEKLSYQSVIRRTNNDLVVNQNVRVKISILQGTISGMAVYVEDHTTSTNSNGLVSLSIGGGNVISGTFSAINWENGPYFVKMEADPTGGTNYTVSGTTQLMSVPYALYAKTSGSSTPGPTGAQGIQGVAGTNGTNGTNGVDGKNSLTKTSMESVGINCFYGGIKIEYGLDANNNGILDFIEINSSLTRYICNGASGTNGLTGPAGSYVFYTEGVNDQYGGNNGWSLNEITGPGGGVNRITNDVTGYFGQGDYFQGPDGGVSITNVNAAGTVWNELVCQHPGLQYSYWSVVRENNGVGPGSVEPDEFYNGINGSRDDLATIILNSPPNYSNFGETIPTAKLAAEKWVSGSGNRVDFIISPTSISNILQDSDAIWATSETLSGGTSVNPRKRILFNGTLQYNIATLDFDMNGDVGGNRYIKLLVDDVDTDNPGSQTLLIKGDKATFTNLVEYTTDISAYYTNRSLVDKEYVDGLVLTGPTGPTGATGATGAQGVAGINGTNGLDGKNTVVKTTTEVAGDNCVTGGVKLEYGIDANNSGVLDAGEINATLTKYVCNGTVGIQGTSGLVNRQMSTILNQAISQTSTNIISINALTNQIIRYSGMIQMDANTTIRIVDSQGNYIPNIQTKITTRYLTNGNVSFYNSIDNVNGEYVFSPFGTSSSATFEFEVLSTLDQVIEFRIFKSTSASATLNRLNVLKY